MGNINTEDRINSLKNAIRLEMGKKMKIYMDS